MSGTLFFIFASRELLSPYASQFTEKKVLIKNGPFKKQMVSTLVAFAPLWFRPTYGWWSKLPADRTQLKFE